MAGLPLVGAQVVIQGTNAFKSDAQGVMTYLSNLGRSLYLLERTTNGAFDGINNAVSNVERSSVRLAAANARVSETLAANYATMAERASAAAAETIAQNNLQRDVIINNSRTVTAQVVRDAQIRADAEIAAANKAAAAQVKSANTRYANRRIARDQQLATDIAAVRANQAPGPVGRANAAIDIAQLKATAAQADQIDRKRLADSKARAIDARTTAVANARATSAAIIAEETAKSRGVITVANQTAAEANRAAQSRAAAEIRAAQAQLEAQQRAAAAAAEYQARIQQVTEATIKTIVALGVAFTAAFAVIIGASTNAASNFEAQMALIQGVTQATAQEMGLLKKAIFDLKDSPTQINDLAEAEYNLATAGASATDIVNGQLKAVNDLIVASGNRLNSNTAAVSIATTTNAFKSYSKEGIEAAQVTDVITAAANKSNQSFESVATAVQRSAGTLARSGVGIQEFGALVTIVGQQIRDGSTAGSALQRVFLDLQNPTDKQNALLEKYRISLYDVNHQLRPTRDFILGLTEAFGEQAIATGKITRQDRDFALSVLFEQNAIRAVNAILDEGIDKFDEYAASSKGAAAAAIAPQLETAAAKYKILQKSVETASIEFGDHFLPLFKDAIDGMTAFVRAIPVDAIGNFSAKILEAAGAIGQFALQLPITEKGVLGVAGAITVAFLPAIARVAAGVLAALAPIVALGTAFGLVAIIFSQEADNIGSILDDLWKQISSFFVGVFEGVKAWATPFIALAAQTWENFSKAAGVFLGQAFETVGKFLEGVYNNFMAFANRLGLDWAKFWRVILTTALGPLGNLLNAIQDLAKIDVGQDNPLKPLLDNVKTASAALDDIYNTLGQNGQQAVTDFGKGFKALFEFAGPAAQKFVADVAASFDGFANRTGATFNTIKNNTDSLIAKLQELWQQATNPQVTAGASPADTFTPLSHEQSTQPGFLTNSKDFEDALKKLLDLVRDTGQAIDKLNKDATDKFADIASKAADAAADAIASVSKSISDAISDANNQIASLRANRAQDLADRARRDALSASQESASLSRDRAREDAEVAHRAELDAADRAYNEQEQLAEEAHKRLEEDANLSHQRQLEDDEIFYKAQQDELRRNFDAQQEIALRAFQDQQDADYRAYQDKVQRDEMAYQHEKDVANSIRDLQKQLNEDLANDAQDTQQKIEEENARHLETLQNAQNQRIIDAENRRHGQQLGRITSAGEDSQSKIEQAAREKQAELDAQYAEEVADYERRQALAEQDRLYRAQQEQALNDFRKQQQLDALKFEEDARDADLARKRQIEDQERARERAQDDADREYKRQQDEAARQRQEQIDEQERARRRQLDDEDRAYNREQQAQQRALEDQLAQEALGRRIAEINAERDARIRALNQELQERLDKIERERQQEIANFVRDLQDRLNAIRQEFVDKLPDIISKGGEAIVPIVNGFLAAIDAQLAAVATSAASASGAIVGSGITALNTLATVAQQTANVVNGLGAARGTRPVTTQYPQDGRTQSMGLVPSYDVGGFIPGPRGKPMLAVVHGGEFVVPASAISASSTPSANMSTMSKTTNYNVEANYGRVQPEGSIRQDLQALIAVSRQ